MPSVELSKLQAIGPVRPLSDADRARIDARSSGSAPAASPTPAAKPGVMIEVGAASAIDPASPPIDPERVEKIRAALRDGSYPLVPTKIADALIAAQVGPAIAPQGQK
jgi:negative regulator of flagellin synthesis FlgM